jgi:hypothetical protein
MPTCPRGARALLLSLVSCAFVLFLLCGMVSFLHSARSESHWLWFGGSRVEIGPRDGASAAGVTTFGWLANRRSPNGPPIALHAIFHPAAKIPCLHVGDGLVIGEVALRYWECRP